MKRRTPLRPGKPITRRTRLRAKGGSRFPKRRDPDYCRWVRETWECALILSLDPCDGPIECAHVQSKGAGGWDWGNTLPLCRKHHRQQHRIGVRSFEVKHGIDLAKFALELAASGPAGPRGQTGQSND